MSCTSHYRPCNPWAHARAAGPRASKHMPHLPAPSPQLLIVVTTSCYVLTHIAQQLYRLAAQPVLHSVQLPSLLEQSATRQNMHHCGAQPQHVGVGAQPKLQVAGRCDQQHNSLNSASTHDRMLVCAALLRKKSHSVWCTAPTQGAPAPNQLERPHKVQGPRPCANCLDVAATRRSCSAGC